MNNLSINDAIIASQRTVRRNITNCEKYWQDICGKLSKDVLRAFMISAILEKKITKITDALNTAHSVIFNDFQNNLSKNLANTGIFQDYNAKLFYTYQTIEIALIYANLYKAFTRKRVAIIWRDMEKDVTFSNDITFDALLKVKHLSLEITITAQNFNKNYISGSEIYGKSENSNTAQFTLNDLLNSLKEINL